jgi:hypothetical protein
LKIKRNQACKFDDKTVHNQVYEFDDKTVCNQVKTFGDDKSTNLMIKRNQAKATVDIVQLPFRVEQQFNKT